MCSLTGSKLEVKLGCSGPCQAALWMSPRMSLFGHLSQCLAALMFWGEGFLSASGFPSLYVMSVAPSPFAVHLSEQSLAVSTLHTFTHKAAEDGNKINFLLPCFLQRCFLPYAVPWCGVTIASTGCCTCLSM